ncbi:A-factor biosynthesis protein [Streptomyces sp. Je 1-79]|nr:A-factor biosynthesis protein [Streptomyces sp. Je 1-79]
MTGVRYGIDALHQVCAQWPRGHSYYGPVSGRWHDPMIFAETIRQACMLLGHQSLGIPMGHNFLTTTHSFAVTAEGARLSDHPADVLLEVALHDIVRRGRNVSSFACSIKAHRDGEPIGVGGSAGSCVPPAVYRRLRGERLGAAPCRDIPPPVAPELVGRRNASDVVLSRVDGEVCRLRFDTSHPILFDHPVDHVPGMVVMEAARQAAILTTGLPAGLLLACSAHFRRYVEFDSPCLVVPSAPEETAPGTYDLSVEFHQDGSLVGSCRVTLFDGSPR